LNKCLDIQGTYEGNLAGEITPPSTTKPSEEERKKTRDFLIPPGDTFKYPKFYKFWTTIEFLDEQTVEVTSFNDVGIAITNVFNMKKESSHLSCTPSAWESSYYKVGWHANPYSISFYYKTTKEPDGSLKGTLLQDTTYERQQPRYSYRKKVDDLTVEDIRADNERAKRAIARYPPPGSEAWYRLRYIRSGE
jgi:hypothetical protein